MAFVTKCFLNLNTHLIKRPADILAMTTNTIPVIRHSSFLTSEKVRPLEEYPEVEIVKNPPEWKYVERLLPKAIVPKPSKKTEYPSGWQPPSVGLPNVNELSYFVARTRNYMLPVYKKVTHRGLRHITVVKFIQGDIYALEKELKEMVKAARNGKNFVTQVNEMSRQLRMHGDHVDLIKDYLKSKGF